LEDAAVPKPIQIDAAAARESKDVETYIGELIRLHVREAERIHELVTALDGIEIEGDTPGNGEAR
jgi:hypothetical protein